MSAQNSSGIQTLLEAERKAHEIVQGARAYRAERLKAVKADSAKEVEAHRAKKQKEFERSEASSSGGTDEAEKQAEQHVQGELKTIKEQGDKARESVAQKIIETVMNPKPELHTNAQ